MSSVSSEDKAAMDLDVLYYRVVVKERSDEKTAGGLYIPDEAKKGSMQTNEGIILGIGPEVKCEPKLNVGDRVYYGKYSGSYFTRNGVEFRIMKDTDLLGKVKEARNE